MVLLGSIYSNMGVEIPCSPGGNSWHLCVVAVPSFQVSEFYTSYNLINFTYSIECLPIFCKKKGYFKIKEFLKFFGVSLIKKKKIKSTEPKIMDFYDNIITKDFRSVNNVKVFTFR